MELIDADQVVLYLNCFRPIVFLTASLPFITLYIIISPQTATKQKQQQTSVHSLLKLIHHIK